MKNIIIIIGTIILGVVIVNTMILGDSGTLESASKDIIEKGIEKIDSLDFN